MYRNLLHVVQDEGLYCAIDKAENWQTILEDISEAVQHTEEPGVKEAASLLLNKVNQCLELLLKRGVPREDVKKEIRHISESVQSQLSLLQKLEETDSARASRVEIIDLLTDISGECERVTTGVDDLLDRLD